MKQPAAAWQLPYVMFVYQIGLMPTFNGGSKVQPASCCHQTPGLVQVTTPHLCLTFLAPEFAGAL